MRDFRFAFRSLVKQPIFTLAAVLTLALGIGANTAIFSVFNAVILRPLPFRDPDGLVLVWQKRPDGRPAGVSAITCQEWVSQATAFEPLLGMSHQFVNGGRGLQSAQVIGAQVSPNFFRVLGIQPAFGRVFDANEGRPNAARVVVLSYRFWQEQF